MINNKIKKLTLACAFVLSPIRAVMANDIIDLISDPVHTIGDFFCQDLGLSTNSATQSICGDPEPAFTQDNMNTVITGRYLISTVTGCGFHSFKPKNPDKPNDPHSEDTYYVSLLGDSLTMFGGEDLWWNTYLGGGKFKVMGRGAAGATSSAWREHFDNCEVDKNDLSPVVSNGVGDGRLRLPPRSVMMIGGNDFHVFKGILQPLWWLIDFRHNAVLNNVERIITHHHKGNDGCGDSDNPKVQPDVHGNCQDANQDGYVNFLDWGRGRLFVMLGNIPAVSYDPSTDGWLTGLFNGLGLYTPLVHDVEIPASSRKGNIWPWWQYLSRRLLDAYVDTVGNLRMQALGKTYKNHSWASREMHVLQENLHDVQVRRGGFPYIWMYGPFRDGGANKRGCYWCADYSMWFGGEFDFKDGIHINHTKGYTTWAMQVLPFMEAANMASPVRTDIFGPPGVEIVDRPAADDLTLIIGCIITGNCHL